MNTMTFVASATASSSRSDDDAMRDIGEEERQRKRRRPAATPLGERRVRAISVSLVVDDVPHRLLLAP